jgi:outer membrane lipoprotein SlyB
MTQTTSSSSSSGFGEGPIRVGGSSFSRPAALIGGAVALIALTAIATTLVVRPGSGASHGGDAMVAAAQLPAQADKTKASGQVHDEVAPDAKAEAKPEPKPAPQRAPATTERKPAAAKAPAAAAPQKTAAVCTTCGTVEAVTPVTQKGEASGIGAVGGAVIGGVLGNQMGSGRGKDAMTAIGVVGGGIAGHEIEKRHKATTVYSVKVRMDDGTTRTVTQPSAPAVGAKVTLEGSQLKPRAS